jgi:hypothetical protein
MKNIKNFKSFFESKKDKNDEITSNVEFKEYAFTVLKKAFGEDFDPKKAQATVNGLTSKYVKDYGAMVGALQASLGSNESLVNEELAPRWEEAKEKYGYDFELKGKKYPVKELDEDECEVLKGFPSFSTSGSVEGMRSKYYGNNALLVKCGDYIYNVTSEPKMYFEVAE